MSAKNPHTELVSFWLDKKYKYALRDYCKDCGGDSMSLFIRRATIDEMKRRGIEPIEEET
jgi:hypothetical protein